MGKIRVALLQLTGCGNNKAASQVKGEHYCREARALGADIAVFPEMWSIGMTFYDAGVPGDLERWQASAIARDDAFIQHFQRLAVELDMAIAITYLENWSRHPRNSVSLIDRHGIIALTFAKVHTCEFDLERALTPGESFPVCALDTANGEVNVGFMICYDREFPESARILMLQGAELILTPNACTLDAHRIGQFKSRAFENMVGVAMANYAAPQNNGHSIAFDAVAYGTADGPSLDTLLIEAGESEGVYVASFDMESIRAYRSRESWGNAYRRPRLYSGLTDTEVRLPFVRPDATR
jgi:predicted amidohydrolase